MTTTNSPTPKLDGYIRKLKHAMLCPRSDGYEKVKPCVCERGEIEVELIALIEAPARARQLAVDECVAIARAESEDLEKDAKTVDGDGIRIAYRTNEVLRLQAHRLTELADKMLEIRYARVPIRPPTSLYEAGVHEQRLSKTRTGCAWCGKVDCYGGCVT